HWADMSEELAGLGYWRLDLAINRVHWSPGMFRIFGFPPGETPQSEVSSARIHPDDRADSNARLQGYLTGQAGQGRTRIVHPDDLPKIQGLVADLFSGAPVDSDKDRSYRLMKPDGEAVWIEGSPTLIYDERGEIDGVITVLRNITERREAQAILAAREAQL